MTRAELVTLLADLVQKRIITAAEAAQTLAAFDQGDADALTALPAAPAPDDRDWLVALALLLLLMGGSARQRLTPNRRQRAQALLRGRFDATTRQLATDLTAGA